jgi:excisionase family DNA binding protein
MARQQTTDRLLYRVKDVAEMCGVKPRTVYRAIAAGELKAVRIGRAVRVLATAIEPFEESCAARAKADAESDLAAVLAEETATAVNDQPGQAGNAVSGEVA